MNTERNAFKAGLFIILSIVGTFLIVLAIRGAGDFVNPMERRHIVFRLAANLSGLRVGDDVRIGGFTVGDVRDISVISRDDPRVGHLAAQLPSITDPEVILVTVGIPKKYQLRKGSRVLVEAAVTGPSAINFQSLGNGEVLAAHTPLIGQAGGVFGSLQEITPSLEGVLAQMNGQTMPSVNGILSDVRTQWVPKVNGAIDNANDTVSSYRTTAEHGTELVDRLKGHVDPLASKVHKVGDSTSGMMDEIRDVFGDTKSDVRGTMSNLNASTGSIKEKLPGILGEVDAAVKKINTAVAGAVEAMEDVKKVAGNTREATGSLKEVLAGNKGRIERIIESGKATMQNAEEFTGRVARSPWRLLYKPKKADETNDSIYNLARDFAEGATELNDAARALRDAVKTPGTPPERVQELMGNVQKSFERFEKSQAKILDDKLWENVKE